MYGHAAGLVAAGLGFVDDDGAEVGDGGGGGEGGFAGLVVLNLVGKEFD